MSSSAGSRGARRGRLRVIGGSTGGASQAGLQKQCWLCGAERWVAHYARALTRRQVYCSLRSVVFGRRNCTTQMLLTDEPRAEGHRAGGDREANFAAGAFQSSRQGSLNSVVSERRSRRVFENSAGFVRFESALRQKPGFFDIF